LHTTLRLGLIVYGSLDSVSGGYLYDRQLVAHLRAAGDEVEIVSLPWRNYGQHLLHNLDGRLRRRLIHGRWDALLQDELNHPSLFLINRGLRRRARCPIVAIVHHLRSSEYRPAWQNYLYRLVEAAYLRSAHGFICNSRTTWEAVSHLLSSGRFNGAGELGGIANYQSPTREPHIVAYPAADHLGPVSGLAELEAQRPKPPPLRLLFLGNVIPRKGLHILLDALARVSGDWRLSVVGDLESNPGYARSVRRRAAHLGGRIQFHGRLDEAGVRAQLAAHHVLAVPSSYEGFGIAYLEAMAFGLPVVASTTGAAGEIVTDGQDGFLVPPEDAGALAEVLQRLLDDPARLQAMHLAARERYERHPTWAESMARVRAFLLEKAPPRRH
jgi:glycosyltransferase involved in cell wall biosynthesis